MVQSHCLATNEDTASYYKTVKMKSFLNSESGPVDAIAIRLEAIASRLVAIGF